MTYCRCYSCKYLLRYELKTELKTECGQICAFFVTAGVGLKEKVCSSDEKVVVKTGLHQ